MYESESLAKFWKKTSVASCLPMPNLQKVLLLFTSLQLTVLNSKSHEISTILLNELILRLYFRNDGVTKDMNYSFLNQISHTRFA